MAGYVTDAGTQAWPNGKIESSVEGPGLIRSITGTNPAAGVEISETVPTGARWRLLSIFFGLTTDATAATRIIQITLNDGTTDITTIQAFRTQTASISLSYYFNLLGPDRTNLTGASEVMQTLPEVLLMAGYKVKTNSYNIQAGDDFAVPQILVEEWIEP